MTGVSRRRGFTLVELVAVIAITGILAAALAVFLPPAFGHYAAVQTRANLSAEAARALRGLRQDLRSAVPNSIRTPGAQCLELVPTRSGAVLDTTGAATTVFDVLTPLASTPTPGDWVVVGNQNPGDVYAGSNRAAITGVATPLASQGRLRLQVAATAFPPGYAGGRFVVVPQAEQAVFYVCSGADDTLDAQGHGKGTLLRLAGYGFNATAPTACPATAGAAVVATGVKRCRFVYDPNVGATQQNGHVSLEIELAHAGEAATLVMGAQVANAP